MPNKLTFCPLAALTALLFAGSFAPLQAQNKNNPIYKYYCDPPSCSEYAFNVTTDSVFTELYATCLLGENISSWSGVEATGCNPPVDLSSESTQGNFSSDLGYTTSTAKAEQSGLLIWNMTTSEYCNLYTFKYIQPPTRCSQQGPP